MQSSLIDVLKRYSNTGTVCLREALAAVPDPRHARGKRHQLVDVLLICVCAVMAGARSFASIRDWAQINKDGVLAAHHMKAPSKPTIRRVLHAIDADTLDRVLGAWMVSHMRNGDDTGMPIAVAIDGKELRGAKHAGGRQTRLLSAMAHDMGVVIGQVSVGEKTNEIPKVKDLLAQIGNVKGMVFTLDALHTQKATAELIAGQGAFYVFTVKANTPSLQQRAVSLPWWLVPGSSEKDTSHGRRVSRCSKILWAPETIDFPHAQQVLKIRRTRTINGRHRWEEVFAITNHPTASRHQVASWVQGHWRIENQLHWTRDVLWDEDRSQTRTGTLPRVMATLRNTALSILHLAGTTHISQTTRYLWANPQLTAQLTGL